MDRLNGIPSSPGIAIAPPFLFAIEDSQPVPLRRIASSDVEGEWARFRAAADKARGEVTALRDKARSEAGEEQAAIFESHLLMIDDPDIHDRMERSLGSRLVNVERVLLDIERELVDKLGEAEDASLRERAVDIKDVARRILGHLLEREGPDLADLAEDVVLVARDLLPSDMISMDRARVKAVVTEAGGRTSHVAILARAFEIPAVLGVAGALSKLRGAKLVAVDGSRGVVLADPDEESLVRSAAARDAAAVQTRELDALRELPAVTLDGARVHVMSNIEVPEEAQAVLAHGADGIGLFRSEFLFLGGHVPDEEEQFRAYKGVIEAMKGKCVTIRTLDIGGDKVLPELGAQDEKNPLLGWRAIRFCLSRQDIFKTQLRAILRAAVFGETRIMFPMIATADELDRALVLVEEAREEVRAKGQKAVELLPVGIMIEIPGAAMTSDILARKAAFFSIGTNDLVQYTMAVDRGNEKVSYLNAPFHPGVLRLIKMTIENGKAAGIPVGMCGEMAADPEAAVVLLGLGLEEFSMSSASVPAVKRAIRSTSLAEARSVARAALALSSSSEISAYLKSRLS
jgi:phosphoenolpyruvate-protein phosphotransferase (PTS system enzyme I)